MSSRMTTAESIRMILVLALVFLLTFLFTGIIGAPIITVLLYFVLQYRRRVKILEGRLAEATGQTTVFGSGAPKPEPTLPPSSTDA